MKLRYHERVCPSSEQQLMFVRAFGCARVVYNDGVRRCREAWRSGEPYICDVSLQKRVITAGRETPERERPTEVSSVSLVQSLQDLHTAVKRLRSPGKTLPSGGGGR